MRLLTSLPLLLALTSASPNTTTYDYIIVGGGLTGLVVSHHLSASPNTSVLVIESGAAYDNPNIRLPYGTTFALNDTLFWKDFTSDPEPQLGNKTFGARVAQILGGGSMVNGMMYDRGSRADYDAWEKLGNKGWGWEGLLPFFKRGTEFVKPNQKLVEEFGVTWDEEA
jgi:choline dehydrogenase-like flavoprotein